MHFLIVYRLVTSSTSSSTPTLPGGFGEAVSTDRNTSKDINPPVSRAVQYMIFTSRFVTLEENAFTNNNVLV